MSKATLERCQPIIHSAKEQVRHLTAESYAKYYEKRDGKYLIPDYEDLPIRKTRDEILQKLDSHQVSILKKRPVAYN